MKRTLCIACLLAVCVAFALPVAAQPRGLPVSFSALQHPDLRVEKIMFTDVSYGDVAATFEVRVAVRNIGTSGADPCNVMLSYSNNTTAPTAMRTWVKRMTHGLNPKGSSVITFELILPHGAGAPWQGMLIAVADPPVSGKPLGEIREWPATISMPTTTMKPKAELNNVFGVIFHTGSNITPLHWDNPAD